jgi:hypothetical protein
MAAKKKDKAPPETPKEDTPAKESEPKQEEELILGKYKTQDELVEAYKKSEKKLGEQGDELRQGREFAQVVQPLLDEIRSDPELFKKLDEKLREKGQSTESAQDETKGDEKTTTQDESRQAVSDLILAKFEEKHGIDRLSTDERKKLRNKIGDVIHELTGKTFNGVDLRRLDGVLENAYILANKDVLIDKSKLEGLSPAKEVDEAGFPSVPSSPGKAETVLTSEEADIAGKLGQTREQYLEGKKGLAK